jgi:hypothetical protein
MRVESVATIILFYREEAPRCPWVNPPLPVLDNASGQVLDVSLSHLKVIGHAIIMQLYINEL